MPLKRSLWILLLSLLLLGTPLTAQDNRFGIVEGFWLPEVVCDLDVGWERIIFDWSQHQPTGPDDWHTLNVDDRWLKAANQCNREVVAVVKHTPEWATEGTPGPGVPIDLDLPLDDPDNVWANFMRQTARYYASRGVNHFVIWNEPDITSDTYGFEFEGTLDDYFQLLKVAYLAAKEGNPAAVIHLAGTTYWHDVNAGRRLYMDRLLERIQQDPEAATNNDYFDVFSLHIYFRTDSVYDIVRDSRQLLDNYGLQDKAIWINETNAAPTDDPAWPVERPQFQLDLTQQASFLLQAAGLGLAAGADRIAVYKLLDQGLPPGGETFGILSPVDSSPRPAFYVWQTVTRYLGEVEHAKLAQSNTVDVVHFAHHNKRQTLLAWARTADATQIQITATGDKAYQVDFTGNITILRPVDGVYTISLPGAVCNETDGCPVGGVVSMLIQPQGIVKVIEINANGSVPLTFEQESNES